MSKKRIAFSVPNINDAVSYGANTLVTGDYAIKNKRFLYVLSAENDKIQLHDGKTEEIKKYIKEIFCDSIEGRELDPASYNRTPIIFMVKRDSNGNKTLMSEQEIVAKLKQFRRDNLAKFKPYILRVDNDGIKTQMLPIFGDDTVFTYMSFDGVEQQNIGMVTETLLERFTNTENNLTTQVMIFYDKAMELAHRVHLADVNQDAKIINALSSIADFSGYLDAVERWLPETKTYSQPPKTLDINLSTSDRSYMYKYKLEDVSKDKIPYLRSGLKLTNDPVGVTGATLIKYHNGGPYLLGASLIPKGEGTLPPGTPTEINFVEKYKWRKDILTPRTTAVEINKFGRYEGSVEIRQGGKRYTFNEESRKITKIVKRSDVSGALDTYLAELRSSGKPVGSGQNATFSDIYLPVNELVGYWPANSKFGQWDNATYIDGNGSSTEFLVWLKGNYPSGERMIYFYHITINIDSVEGEIRGRIPLTHYKKPGSDRSEKLKINEDIKKALAGFPTTQSHIDKIVNAISDTDINATGKYFEISDRPSHNNNRVLVSKCSHTPVGGDGGGYATKYELTIGRLDGDSRKVFSDLESTSSGSLHNMTVSHSILEPYTVTTTNSNGFYNNRKYDIAFPGNPSATSDHVYDFVGDSDNKVRTVSGTLKIDGRTDVPKDAVFDLPWITVSAECHSTTSGEFLKKVNATFANGSYKYSPSYDELMANKPIDFTINLAGAYKVKVKATVYWGRFGSWTDEVELAYFGVARGNHSGGDFSINHYLFNGQSNRIITRCALVDASKYEHDIFISGRRGSYGWGGRINPPVTWEENATLTVPYGADYWYARFYGKMFEKPGCNFNRVEWHNLHKQREVDMSSSIHYHNTAKNLSLLKSIQILADFRGDSTNYETRYMHIPFIYPALTSDHTFMVRGGSQYTLITDAITPKLTQIGIMHIDTDTFGEKQENSLYLGGKLITDDKVRIGTTYWQFTVNGDSRGMLRSAPREEHSSARRRRSLMLNYYPEEEKGLGALYNIQIDNTEWNNHNKYFLILNCKDGNNIEIEFVRGIINNIPYLVSKRDDKYRVYVYRENEDTRIITYGINAKTARLGYIDDDKMFITLSRDGKEYQYKLHESGDIPFNIGDKIMYLRSEELRDPEIENVYSPDVILTNDEYEIEVVFNGDIERPEILVKDSQGNIVSRVVQ